MRADVMFGMVWEEFETDSILAGPEELRAGWRLIERKQAKEDPRDPS
jgi:hypothetical protein